MNDCLFCKIINKEIPSSVVYEDEIIEVIMNINPNTNGHLLVIPKEHYTNVLDLPNEVIDHSLDVIRTNIYPKLKEKLSCEGLTLAQNNELGQEIKHFHLHLIPRYPDDNADFNYDESKLSSVEEIYNKIMD